jgi:hypothetical protein
LGLMWKGLRRKELLVSGPTYKIAKSALGHVLTTP